MKANCIICIKDDSYQVVGPFDDHENMLAWGRRWQEKNGDDPRWQTVYLADPSAPPTHIVP